MADLRARLPLWAPSTLVLAIAGVAMQRVVTQHWREGAVLLAAALLVAAVLRALLPDGRAGLLAIRSRAIDVACYGAFGVVLLVLAVTISRGPLIAV